jgi:hypothetical protein
MHTRHQQQWIGTHRVAHDKYVFCQETRSAVTQRALLQVR